MTTTDRIKITHAALRCALDALRDISIAMIDESTRYPNTFAAMMRDDYSDYANAARDQIDFCTDMLIDDDFDDTLFDSILTMTSNQLQNSDNALILSASGFIYGYADHQSPISDMMHANKFDDELPEHHSDHDECHPDNPSCK